MIGTISPLPMLAYLGSIRGSSMSIHCGSEETLRTTRPKISGSNKSSLHAAKPSRDREGAEPSCRLLTRAAREFLCVRRRAKPNLPGFLPAELR